MAEAIGYHETARDIRRYKAKELVDKRVDQRGAGAVSLPYFSDSDVPRWMQATFQAKDVHYSEMLLVTHPPQRQLSFALDGTPYRAILTEGPKTAVLVPAVRR